MGDTNRRESEKSHGNKVSLLSGEIKCCYPLYPYRLIGNCQISARIGHQSARLIVPSETGYPDLGKILDPEGSFFHLLLRPAEMKAASGQPHIRRQSSMA